jgi:hypothetical protein
MKPYVTEYLSISGWKAVYIWWNPKMGGFYEPLLHGFGAYGSRETAAQEARSWAEDEGIEYRPGEPEGP